MLNKNIKEIQSNLENWWEFGDQESPCIIASKIIGDIPDTDNLKKHWEDTDHIMKRINAIAEKSEFYGEAVPMHYIDYGASAMAGALGAKMEYMDKETIWAYPVFNNIEQVMDIHLDENNSFYRRILDLTLKSASVAKDHHFITPFALGGLTDSLSSMYGCEEFLIDMIAEPEMVHKALNNMKNIWIASFDRFKEIIKTSGNLGGIGWAGIWAPGTTFPIQEDISYMFSNEMFKKFCIPNLVDIFSVVDYPMYHLDGVGAIQHLDSLLEVEELKVIQWVPGAGQWDLSQWQDLIGRILSKGKSLQLYASNLKEIDSIVNKFGSRGLLFTISQCNSDEELNKIIDKYGSC